MLQKANSHFKWSVLRLGLIFTLVYRKDQFWDLCYFWLINGFLNDQLPISMRLITVLEISEISTGTHNHLGKRLDSKLNYENHVSSVFSRVNKTIGILRKFQPTLPRKFLVIICKSFIRPHLDYCDIMYNWASNELNLFNKALELQ